MLTKTVNRLLQFELTINVCVAAPVAVRLLTFMQVTLKCQDKSVNSDWPSLNKQRHYSVKPSIQLLCNTRSYSHIKLRSVQICLLSLTNDLSGITLFCSSTAIH